MRGAGSIPAIAGLALATTLLLGGLAAASESSPGLTQLVLAEDHAGLRAMGPGVLDTLVDLYASEGHWMRAKLAAAFASLGWKSEKAKRIMLADIRSPDPELRVRVLRALGRVSDSPEVVEILLDNMMQDPNPLVRDEAASALARGQIHLSDAAKLRLYAGLIYALGDPKPQVRAIAFEALQVQTGQTRGFSPEAPKTQRAESIRSWQAWLDEVRAHL